VILEGLAKSSDETCNMGVLVGGEVLYMIKKESSNPFRMSGQVEKKLPAHCTALGKVLLSGLSVEELGKAIDNAPHLEAFSINSIATLRELKRHLVKVRQTGLAFDDEELNSGAVRLAGPVREYRGRIIAAISISFPKHRIVPGKLEAFKALLSAACLDFSRQLGYQSPVVLEVQS